MENWGLIIFSEEMLIHRPGYTDGLKNKECTIRMIAHEIAHMWFGNSVTLSWWSHFWLNEGFARFYEIFTTDQIYHYKYHMEEQFVVDYLQRILEKDAVAASLPLTSPEITIQSFDEIDTQANFFAYEKGASIIRMWRNLMGSDNFNKSINSYLKQYHLKNTNPRDLFAHLKQNWPSQPEVDLDTFFSDFTEQVGYPMVIVNITQDNQKIILHQKRFLYDYEDGSDATLRYTIPITFTTNLDQSYYNLTPYTYFNKNDTTVEISFENPIEWIIINQKQSNYYRVFYDQPILTQIKQLFSTSRSRRIPATTKAQIIDDLFNFAYAGMIDYADVFEYLEYLRYEFNYVPWNAAYHGMERVVQRLTPQQLPYFEKYLSNITTGIFNELSAKSSSSDSVMDVYNRVLHVSWLCKYQNTNCNKQVELLFLGNLEKPSPDYRKTFYCAVSRTDAHARLWELYNNEIDSDDKNLILRSISCSRDYRTYIKLELFHLIPYSKQPKYLKEVYQQNPDLIDPIFSMISENIDVFVARLGKYEMIEVLSDMVDYFTTREQEEQFTNFMDRNIYRFGESAQTLKETFLTTIRKNLEWTEQRLGNELAFIMKGSIVGLWLLTAVITLNLIANSEIVGYRLSSYIRPSFYNLSINIQDDASNPGTTFNGEVAITLQSNQSNLLEITLHKELLNITRCLLYNKDGRLQQDIAAGQLRMQTTRCTLSTQGKVQSDTLGLFSKENWNAGNSSTRAHKEFLFLTQFELNDARFVFPCFDEPAFKASFSFTLGRPSGYNAVSNTRLMETTNEGKNYFVDHFEVTPIMSTYLVAFLISNYQARGNISDFAVLSSPEHYNKTEFSYNVGKRVVAAFNELFPISYKQLGNDVLLFASVPSFDIVGMENWGLIFYSEELLVQKPGYTDGFVHKEFTCRMIAHEMAHMWFGNSVTLSWWSHFWLNAGFARLYEILVTHQLYPEYHLDQQFVIHLQTIFDEDAMNSSQPLSSSESSIQTESEFEELFGSFSYEKGASIIRMWRSAMGAVNFDNSINSYLKQYHLKNTNPSDLFAHLKLNWPAQPEVVLDTFFSDFTEQVGYPMVIVNITQDNQKIILRQKRFLYNYDDGSDATLRYTIPITFATNVKNTFDNLTPYTYFDKNNTTVEIFFKEPIEWIILNLKQTSYYRVLYDKPILAQLKLALSKNGHSSIPVENRAQIIDDLFSFALAGMIDYVDVFKFLEYLKNEFDYVPWYAAYRGLLGVSQRLTPHQLPYFAKYLNNITSAVFAKLTVKSNSDDTVMDVYNRQLQVSLLCKYQNTECNNQVKLNFEADLEKPSPDYRETFYCAAARTTGYARILDLYSNESDLEEKHMLWRALSCTRDYRAHYNNMVFNSKIVENKTVGVTQMYEENPDLITPILSMLAENITKWSNFLGDSWETLVMLNKMSESFTTVEQANLFAELIDKNSEFFGTDVEVLESALERVKKNLEWAKQRLSNLNNYLRRK
ncbi:LOW QUALITY PROTEIN: aminopeptidase Ey-like [Drosophila nasuta]|uniref:LOW QUALITY PROTEIN: aminopeptidase Ey-like n=2 Tax=Drosophila nasuta TaxID=42062 RepID=UPI00295E3C29|nr:LOW QUALITY PROTEIN: aminopeptidase Ey-like [Drosophila nasuta]